MLASGIALFRSAVGAERLQGWFARADGLYSALEAARKTQDPTAINRLVPSGQRFAPTASSFTIATLLSAEELRVFGEWISSGPAGDWLRCELAGAPAWDLDQSWVRRQYAPQRYPRWHMPHGWHQDGALGIDFTQSFREASIARRACRMITCWIALVACGRTAPGLELSARKLDALLDPQDLTEERVRSRFPVEDFWRPELQAGDALLFHGDVLHRTHVRADMTEDRTSIETRFFPANSIPERFRADRFIYLNPSV